MGGDSEEDRKGVSGVWVAELKDKKGNILSAEDFYDQMETFWKAAKDAYALNPSQALKEDCAALYELRKWLRSSKRGW